MPGEQSKGIAKVANIMIDVNDLQAEAEFWQAVLGSAPTQADEQYIWFGGESLALQKVPEPKIGKNRSHHDMHVENLDAAIDQLTAIGATVIQPPPTEGFRWAVMSDPEGNEFCITAG